MELETRFLEFDGRPQYQVNISKNGSVVGVVQVGIGRGSEVSIHALLLPLSVDEFVELHNTIIGLHAHLERVYHG